MKRFEELFEEAGPGIIATHCSRGVAAGDFDNDGDIDLLISNMNEPPSLLRNDVAGDHRWLKVKLIGVKSNRSAVGARVTARYGGKVQCRHCSRNPDSCRAVINDCILGSAMQRLRPRNPRGPRARESIAECCRNQLVVIREGAGIQIQRFAAIVAPWISGTPFNRSSGFFTRNNLNDAQPN